jgi:hypothetical protein
MLRLAHDVGRRALEHRDVAGVAAMDGIRVTAVAPLPMTTTRLPV